jgi:hypothetical protein
MAAKPWVSLTAASMKRANGLTGRKIRSFGRGLMRLAHPYLSAWLLLATKQLKVLRTI